MISIKSSQDNVPKRLHHRPETENNRPKQTEAVAQTLNNCRKVTVLTAGIIHARAHNIFKKSTTSPSVWPARLELQYANVLEARAETIVPRHLC